MPPLVAFPVHLIGEELETFRVQGRISQPHGAEVARGGIRQVVITDKRIHRRREQLMPLKHQVPHLITAIPLPQGIIQQSLPRGKECGLHIAYQRIHHLLSILEPRGVASIRAFGAPQGPALSIAAALQLVSAERHVGMEFLAIQQ